MNASIQKQPFLNADYHILHLGLGSFHRAHQAMYMQKLIDQGDNRWALIGANIRPDMEHVIEALDAQGCSYTLEMIDPKGVCEYKEIQSIKQVLAYQDGLKNVIEVGCLARTRIISFTVTEGGYYLDEHDKLDTSHAALKSDIEHGTLLTIYGTITAILLERMVRATGGITLLSCDNLRGNGDRFKAGLLDFLQRRQENALLAWMEQHITCPNSMVDRITPRPSAAVQARVKAATNKDDECAVMAESFTQWVIEDHFCHGRPDFEAIGVALVDSVLSYEEAKIRILNASHSCIAWAGALKEFTYIHEGVQDNSIYQLAYNYVKNDVIPCLTPSPIDLNAYLESVLHRFSSPYLLDTNQRVAADGFSKIPSFLLPTIKECMQRNASFLDTAKVLVVFFMFLKKWHNGQIAFTYQDPALNIDNVQAIFKAQDPLLAYAHDAALWGDLVGHPALIKNLRVAYIELAKVLTEKKSELSPSMMS